MCSITTYSVDGKIEQFWSHYWERFCVMLDRVSEMNSQMEIKIQK